MGLLSPLTPDERSTFLVVALPEKSLVKLAGRLGTAPPGTRLDRLGTWDLAWSLVDYYDNDPEVAEVLERADGGFRGGSEPPRQLTGCQGVPEGRQPLLDVQDLGPLVAATEDAHATSLRLDRVPRKRGGSAGVYRCGARSRRIASFGFAPMTRATSCPPLNRMRDGIDITP